MGKLIEGTATNKKYGVVRSNHPAGPAKMRCPGCKVGICVEQYDTNGKKVWRCQRCGRDHTFTSL